MEDLEREYLPSYVISTNIDEELAKHDLDVARSDEGPPKTAAATEAKNNVDRDGSASSSLFIQNPWTKQSDNQSNGSDRADLLDNIGEGVGKGSLSLPLELLFLVYLFPNY